ncbi:NtaA/DmoA family FMN-dependent monooxygenase [Roseomonas indoligenes]|uniref:NtaA/DmoA family FMN-dependent monooxygenase n=1 Tax=Roseomonas indoligenes TaxID=2820811 RepID=A0A940N3Y6_9PROT|nr:NtaA/DmoA family FMN-dependent monooxygenase [Pararoseomonas indoligenes]MBP0496335.1 NtaA/DmoA family FMN-dependent monooxygenase [Pararoseomonas indoligenes]
MPVLMIHLGLDISYAHMAGRWRHPGALRGHAFPDVALYEEIARLAERGLLDMVFSGDGTGVPDTWGGSRDAAVEWGINWPRQDFNPMLVAMSRVTSHIGFGLTYSSTFMHPYYTARLLNSLDHITGGRVAMNLVTSTRKSDAANFGFDELMEHAARYERMEEFVDVCRKLWDSAEPDAMLWDAATGRVTDPAKIHDVHHRGRFFKVDGPLNTSPSPQGRPVLIQAGGSPRGIRASAYVADHVFGGDMPLALQVKQRQALDEALSDLGRDPATVGILWQTPIAVAETEHEAIARRDRQLATIPPEAVGAYLSYNGGYDLSALPARFTLGELQREIIAANASPMGVINRMAMELGADTEISRSEFLEHGARFVTNHDTMLAGTAAQIADRLEESFEATGSRGGFMLGHTASLMEDLTGIVELLVPELQRRGRFRTAYTGRTLREMLSA